MRLATSGEDPHIAGSIQGSLPPKAHLLGQVQNKASDSLLLTLKWDRPMVCLTMFGVTVLIFHRSNFLCSQGSFSTGRKWGWEWGWRRAEESQLEEERDGIIAQPFLGR